VTLLQAGIEVTAGASPALAPSLAPRRADAAVGSDAPIRGPVLIPGVRVVPGYSLPFNSGQSVAIAIPSHAARSSPSNILDAAQSGGYSDGLIEPGSRAVLDKQSRGCDVQPSLLKLFGAPAFVLMSALCSASATAGDPLLEEMDRLVSAEMSRQKIPGMAIAVVKNGEVMLAKGYGFASLEHKVPVTGTSIFQAGSVGKQFTAIAIMLLKEQGKLRLDDPIARYLPRTKARWGSITVRHLLTHTAGLPDYEDEVDTHRDYSEHELTELVGLLPRASAPGEKFEYSNSGYLLLGVVIRTLSGKLHGDFIRENIFEPLGMTTARLLTDAETVPDRVAGYQKRTGQILHQEWMSSTFNQTADGCFYLSLNDFLAWERAVRARALLKPRSWSEILTPVALNSGKTHPYGFGWEITQQGGQTVHGHDGSFRGFEAIMTRYIEDDVTIIALANLADVDLTEITEIIAKRMKKSRGFRESLYMSAAPR
jgi:CubicO group peptidase (beta-lactamase class C family)